MTFKFSFRKVLSVIATIAVLLNSLATPFAVLAQETTPEPTPEATVTPTSEPTVEPTFEPTTNPSETPVETSQPTPEVTVEPTPSTEPTSAPQETQQETQNSTDENTQPQAPPGESSAPTPTVTPVQPVEEGLLSAEVIETSLFSETLEQNSWFSLITDKLDYAPTEAAVISGSGFSPNTTYSLTISSNDDPATSTTVSVTTDSDGSFTHIYQLDGTYRPNYLVEIKEGEDVIATTTFTDSHIVSHQCTNDLQGPNDEPGQKDLNMMCVDETNLPDSIDAEWNWDETGWSGANTGDACALFDTDGDGFANFASCVTVEDDPAVQTSGSPRIFTCNDTKVDRCAGDSLVAGPYTSTCDVSIVTPQSFPDGDSSPNDTNAQCTIDMDEVGGSDVAELIDVCSYPSEQPNSDPSDCIIFEPGTGRLEVIKDLIPSSDTGLFNLQINGTTYAANISDGGTTGEQVLEVANNGTVFAVGETAGTSTDLSNYSTTIVCKDVNGTGSVVASSTNAGPLNVTLNEEDDIVCTITNNLQKGHLVVQKTTFPSGDPTQFSINATGSGTITGGGAGVITDTTDKDYEVTAGTYTVTETVPTGWTQTGNTCTDVVVTGGQTATCTITNAKKGHIVVDKVTNPGNDPQSFSFVATGGTYSNFSLTDQATPNDQELVPGAYSVTETVPAGWDLTSTSCVSSIGDTEVAGSLELDAGETITCTFTNTKRGGITVEKQTDPDGDTQLFGFTASYNANGFSLSDGQTNNSGFLVPGTYSVSENTPAGWDLTSATCTDGSSPASISLSAGEFITCTFNNQKDSNIVVVKQTNPDANQTNFEFDTNYGSNFFLSDGQSNNSGDLNPGTYSVSEILPLVGWDLTSAICSDGSQASSIDLSAGETVTCTFTNTQRGTISGYKYEDANGDGTNSGDWTPVTDWVIELWQGQTMVAQTTTDATGFYSFTNLVQGAYQLIEQVLGGWINITPSTINVALNPGETDSGNNFVNTQYGTITVVKQTFPVGTAQTFEFDTNYSSNFFLGSGGVNGSGNLLPGTYSVSEIVPSGWDLTNAECSDRSNPNSINLSSNEDVTCTFTNVQRGQIVVDKVTNPSGSTQSFTFTPSYGSNFNLTDTDTPNNSGVLTPGTYAVSESSVAGWDLTDVACVSTLGDTEVPASLDLDAGETITCTFTNTQRGGITVEKQTDPDGDSQTFTFSTNYNTGGFTLSDGQSNLSGALVPGIYSVSENTPAGWDLLSAICSDQSNPTAINLSAGENVTCVFTNQKDSNIVVIKETNPDGSQENFEFDASYHNDNFLLTDGFFDLSGDLNPGTYSVTELPEAGWDLASATCDDGSDPASISLQSGETVVCTFTNTQRGHIVVDKVTDPSGESQSFDFSVTGSGYSSFSLTDQANPNDQEVVPGNYTVSEIVPAGWDLTNTTCISSNNDAETAGDLSVDPGETITCTFTNQKDANIIVVKETDPDGSQDSFEFESDYGANFFLSDGLSNDSGDLDPGIYSVTELFLQGWTFTGSICSDQSDPSSIDLAAGETVTCTFSNTKLATLGDFIWEDTNSDGIQDPGESGITGVSVDLYLDDGDGVFEPGTDDVLVDTQVSDGLVGDYLFEDLLPGDYWADVDESTAPAGYALTTANDPLLVTILSGDNFMDADFGFVPPTKEIVITKSNDRSSEMTAGTEVNYTLTITNSGNVALSNVIVKDVIPGGFTYVSGSTTGATTSDPTISGSTLTWNLGDFAQGESKSISYRVDTNDDLSDGLFTNFATCAALYGREETINCNTASSNVTIGSGPGYGGNLNGQVLGASTELPATGSPSAVLLIALGLITSGLILKKKYVKN